MSGGEGRDGQRRRESQGEGGGGGRDVERRKGGNVGLRRDWKERYDSELIMTFYFKRGQSFYINFGKFGHVTL